MTAHAVTLLPPSPDPDDHDTLPPPPEPPTNPEMASLARMLELDGEHWLRTHGHTGE